MRKIKEMYWKLKSNFVYQYMDKSRFGGIQNVDKESGKSIIASKLREGKPFALARMGFGEIAFFYECIAKEKNRQPLKGFKHSGLEDVFGYDELQIKKYMELLQNCYSNIDIFACWYRDYQESKLMKWFANQQAIGVDEAVLETFLDGIDSWVQELKGKRVLVVTAFAKTIESQYKNKDLIYPNGFLPDFELKTYQSVWYDNDAGKDERFETWYDALEYMKNGIDEIDYDVALLGCGAFGTPLVTHIKEQGKQAIYVGGVLQLMFGIRGSRWDDPSYAAYHSLFNEYWVYPGDDNKPKNSESLEDGCYW